MPYLQLDLDAKKKIPHAARIAGIPESQLGWGLMDLWEWCWLKKRERVSLDLLEGFFGAPGERVARALVAFEFAEQLGGEIRVRGAKRYLRISEVRSEAGKARASRAERDAGGRLLPKNTAADGGRDTQHTASNNPANAGEATSNQPAPDQPLHRTPNTDHREEDPPPARGREDDLLAPENDPSGDFERSPAGRFLAWMQEVNPDLWRKLPDRSAFLAWYAGALRELSRRGMGDAELRAAYEAFCADGWARKLRPPCAWDAWLRKWPEYVPAEPEGEPETAIEQSDTPAGRTWATALERLRADGKTLAVGYLQRLAPVGLHGHQLELEAPDPHLAAWVRDHYGSLLADVLADDGLLPAISVAHPEPAAGEPR